MTGNHHGHGHSSRRHDNHNVTKRAKERRRDQEYRERLIKKLKERRSRKGRRRMARNTLDVERNTPWWFEMDALEYLIRNWMVAERKDSESRNADEWNKTQEGRKRFALAELERKFNTAKAARAVKKGERDQALRKAWENEFNRWMEELKIADSHDSRHIGADEDGVTWSRQSLVDINRDISKRHLTKCMPSFQEPECRGVHCEDCEDEKEVGHFWDEVRRLRL
ncbi:hypothetical protein BGAL_0327g00100 [Botrytis galanthina]|uniref:Uncharacterized protein n=1 Tax=Botrytis galanthina TaxID=278940 RepID=A0A4V4HU01_9HELO|nr:hypothetical protein BGAL_0327g00100 [Botrytis galanthina]